jgi:hypothetical protein
MPVGNPRIECVLDGEDCSQGVVVMVAGVPRLRATADAETPVVFQLRRSPGPRRTGRMMTACRSPWTVRRSMPVGNPRRRARLRYSTRRGPDPKPAVLLCAPLILAAGPREVVGLRSVSTAKVVPGAFAEQEAWRERAACRGVGAAVFHSSATKDRERALSFCARCTVVAECDALARQHTPAHLSVYGGRVVGRASWRTN